MLDEQLDVEEHRAEFVHQEESPVIMHERNDKSKNISDETKACVHQEGKAKFFEHEHAKAQIPHKVSYCDGELSLSQR